MISLKRIFHEQHDQKKQLSKTQLLDKKVGVLTGLEDIDSSLDLAKKYVKENFDRISSRDTLELSSLVSDIEDRSFSLWSLSLSLKKKNNDAEGAESHQENENEYDYLDFDDLDALDEDSGKQQDSTSIKGERQASDEANADTEPQSLTLRFDKEFIDELNDKISANSCQCGHRFDSQDICHAYDGEYDEPDDNPRRIMWLRCPECDSKYKMTIRPRIWLTQQKDDE